MPCYCHAVATLWPCCCYLVAMVVAMLLPHSGRYTCLVHILLPSSLHAAREQSSVRKRVTNHSSI